MRQVGVIDPTRPFPIEPTTDFGSRAYKPLQSAASAVAEGARQRHLNCAFLKILIAAFAILSLTSCQTIRHHFLDPSRDWQARNGQLLYRGKRTTLIGEVLVRFSKAGDFQLTFTKGPGIALLELRQDAYFARVRGPLARGTWSGPVAEAPARLRGWLHLREVLMDAGAKTSVNHSAGSESFIFRF